MTPQSFEHADSFAHPAGLQEAMLALRHAKVDLNTGRIHRDDGSSPSLTALELSLLTYLVDRAGEPQSRETLLTEVWGYRPGVSSRALDTAIKILRQKIEGEASSPDHIHTVRGVGYRFAKANTEDPDFVGRRALLQRVRDAVASHALVTLVGMAGVGKTRLAQALGAPGRVCRVDLIGVTDVQGLEAAVSVAVGGKGALEARLRMQMPLLILDNLEQVAEVAGPRCRQWSAIEGVRILGTSRVPLGIAEEHQILIEPLTLEETVHLFRRRASRSAPHLATMPKDFFEALAGALGGLPLAVELAAGRAAILSPAEIVDRLASLDVLRSPTGESVENSIARSWELLDPVDQRTLAWCSLFVSRFSGSDVEALSEDSVIDSLARLASSHLLRHTSEGLSLHPLVRTFVRPRAEAMLPTPWQRLGTYILSKVASNIDAVAWLPELAALLHRDHDPTRLARAGIWATHAYAHLSVYEGRKWAAAAAVDAARDAGDGILLVEATNAATRLRLAMGQTTDAEVEGVVALARQYPGSELALALLHQALHARLAGNLAEALEACEEAASVATGVTLADVLSERAVVQRAQGRLLAAVASLRESLAVCTALDSTPKLAIHMHRLGSALLALDRRLEAEQLLRRSEALHRENGFTPGAMVVRATLADFQLENGDPQGAQASLEPCLTWAEKHGAADIQLILRSLHLRILFDLGDLDAVRVTLAELLVLKTARKMDPSILAQLDLLTALLEGQTRSLVEARPSWDRAVESALESGRSHTKIYALGYRAGLYGDTADLALLRARTQDLEEVRPLVFADWILGKAPPEGLRGFHLRMWQVLVERLGR